MDSGAFVATLDGEGAIARADAVIVTVGTPLGADLRADRSQVVAALEARGEHLRPGALVVMRSTLSPETTDTLVVPTLERATGRRVGGGYLRGFLPRANRPGQSHGRAEDSVVSRRTRRCA